MYGSSTNVVVAGSATGEVANNSSFGTLGDMQSIVYRETVSVKTRFRLAVLFVSGGGTGGDAFPFQYAYKIFNPPYVVKNTEPAHCEPFVSAA